MNVGRYIQVTNAPEALHDVYLIPQPVYGRWISSIISSLNAVDFVSCDVEGSGSQHVEHT